MNSPIPSHALEPAQLRQLAYVLAVSGTEPKNTVLDGIRARLSMTFALWFIAMFQSIYAAWAVCVCGFLVTLLFVLNHRWMIEERKKINLALYKFSEVAVSSDEINIHFPLTKTRMIAPLSSLSYTRIDNTLLVLRSRDFEASTHFFVAANEKLTLDEAILFLKEHGCLPEEQQHPQLVEAPKPQDLLDKYTKYKRRLIVILIGIVLIGVSEIKKGDAIYSLETMLQMKPSNPIKLTFD